MKKKSKINWPLIAGIIGVIFMVISPWLFTRYSGWLYFDSNDSDIGDTIGGITAPVASLIGSILVYFALKEQIKANDIISKQLRTQEKKELSQKISFYIFEQVKFIRDDILSFLVIETNKNEKREHVGAKAIDLILYVFLMGGGQVSSGTIDSIPDLNRINSILTRFMLVWRQCEDKGLLEADADYLRNLVLHTYNYHMRWTLKEYENFRPDPEKIEMKGVGLLIDIYDTYDWLNNKMSFPTYDEPF